jgi:hypothetical protein
MDYARQVPILLQNTRPPNFALPRNLMGVRYLRYGPYSNAPTSGAAPACGPP